MKKLLVCFAAAALLLCGCGKETSPAPAVLDLWVTSQGHAETYQALAQAWNSENSDNPIQLNTSVYSSQSISSKFSRGFSVSTSFSGDSIPDLVELDYATFPEYVFQQTADLYPLKNMMTKHNGEAAGLTLYSKNGICFALPYHGQQLVLCYRLDLEKELPGFCRNASSFEGLLEMGQSYVESGNGPLLYVDYLGSETFLALYVQALETLADPDEAYNAAIAYLEEAQNSGICGYLESGNAYADSFPELLSQQKITCLVTTQANLLRLAQDNPQIADSYGVLALPSFREVSCRVDAPAVAVAIHMSGGDSILSRDFLEYCRFSEVARAYPLFYLGEEANVLPALSDIFRTSGKFDQPEGTQTFTASEVEPYLSRYSQQVLSFESS